MPKKGDDSLFSLPQRSDSSLAIYDKLQEKIFSTLHVADIGTITAIDAATGYLTVKPIIRERIVGADGKTSWKELAEIPDTPYLAVGGATPAVGQSVLIIYCDRDFSGWLKQGGTNASGNVTAQNPEILRYHALSNAVALVGFGTNANIVSSATYGTISSSTSATDIGVSQALIDMIKSWEGRYPSPYWDDIGKIWTIGYGHTFTPPWTGSNPMTDAQMDALLKSDVAPFAAKVVSIMSGTTLSQNQKDALTDFCFNLGAGCLEGSTLEKDIKRGITDSNVLKVDFEAYAHAKGKLIPGLVHRRDAEWAMFCNGNYLKNG